MSRPAILIASNRGPVSFVPDEEGELQPKRGAGGLVTALTGALEIAGGLWIASAMSEGDRQQVERSPSGRIEVLAEDVKFDLRYLAPSPETFERYYNVISNRVLWFLQHYLWDTVRSPRFGAATREAWEDYIRVNRMFAEALAEEGSALEVPPAYLVQDYHLALVPGMLRERRPEAAVAHFSHTPFADPTYLRVLPDYMSGALVRGMLGADVLGFQSEAWAENFLLCCRALPEVAVDLRRRRVTVDGRQVSVHVYPISVDVDSLRELEAEPDVRRTRRDIARWRDDARMILRVDRSELSKNILRGFLAYETLLQRYPQWRGRVKHLAHITPSRREIPEYRAYTRECLATVERINGELGTEDWQPIEVRLKDDYRGAVAAYGLYDVLIVNPVFDGMNLVSMEGPSVNRRNGVLILSRNAGAHSILGQHALGVNPFDVGEMADAIHRALIMTDEERASRARGLRRVIRANPIARWVERQLDDLQRAVAARGAGPPSLQ